MLRRTLVDGLALVALSGALGACTAGSDPSTSGAEPSTSVSATAQPGQVLWRSAPHFSDSDDVGVLGPDILALMPASTTLVSPTGEVLWTVREPKARQQRTETLVVAGQVVRLSRPGGTRSGLTQVRVLDGRTGDLLWSRAGLDQLDVAGGLLLGTDCTGGPTRCRLLALEPTSGSVAWRVAQPAVRSVDVAGTVVLATSYPHGTEVAAPDAGVTRVDAYDAVSGHRVGRTRTASAFTLAGDVLIGESFASSRGRACSLTMTARGTTGSDLWRHTVRWTRAPGDSDCAQAPVLVVTGDAVVLRGVPAHHEVYDALSGRARTGTPHPSLATLDGIDVRLSGGHATARDGDGTVIWRVQAPGQVVDAGSEHLAFSVTGPHGGERTVIRSVPSGTVVVTAPGLFLGSGQDWFAVFERTGDSSLDPGRLKILAWPH